MRSTKNHSRTLLTLGLLLAAASSAAAGGLSPRQVELLRSPLAQLERVAPLEAEEAHGVLTRSHPHDPRPWYDLGRARFRQGSTWSARAALAEAARRGTRAFRERIQRALAGHDLELLPEVGEYLELDAFLPRAGEDACARRRRDPEAPRCCPVHGQPFQRDGAGRPACVHHAEDRIDRAPVAVTRGLLDQALARPEAWLRREAILRVDPAELDEALLEELAVEVEPAVRRAVLVRIQNGAPWLEAGPELARLARSFAHDRDDWVRLEAWRVLDLLGETPEPTSRTLGELLLVADAGRLSPELVRATFEQAGEQGGAVAAAVLADPSLPGKRSALRVLAASGEAGERELRGLLAAGAPGLRWMVPEVLRVLGEGAETGSAD